jgi:hypothetical protein
MEDFRDITSMQKTIDSYMEAFTKMSVLCPRVEPSSNEFNGRAVLPTNWRPMFGVDSVLLLPHATRLSTTWESLFDFDNPKAITPQYTIWRDSWFRLHWYIDFPFTIYSWEMARRTIVNDDPENPVYETTPEQMNAWHDGHITLSSDSWYYKTWSLKDWREKYYEILSTADVCTPKIAEGYRSQVAKANSEVDKWQKALANLTMLASS